MPITTNVNAVRCASCGHHVPLTGIDLDECYVTADGIAFEIEQPCNRCDTYLTFRLTVIQPDGRP